MQQGRLSPQVVSQSEPIGGPGRCGQQQPLGPQPALVLWCQPSLESAADVSSLRTPRPSWPPLQSQEGAASQEAPDWGSQGPAGVQWLSVTMQGFLCLAAL